MLAGEEVLAGGHANEAGLLAGDVLWAYEGWSFSDGQQVLDLKKAIDELIQQIEHPGEGLRKLIVLRNGQAKAFEVPPGPLGVHIVDKLVPDRWLKTNTPPALFPNP